MQLYFLRHGEADWPGWTKPDDERPLTDFGKKEVRQVAKFLSRLKVKLDSIVTSPLPRALQTAEIAAEQLKQRAIRNSAGLQPKVNFAAQPVQANFAVRLGFSLVHDGRRCWLCSGAHKEPIAQR